MTTPGSDRHGVGDDAGRTPTPAPEPPPEAVADGRTATPGGGETVTAPPEIESGRSRVGGVWVAAVITAVILLLLLIFVLENGQTAKISFFGQHGHLPQGVALLLAAVAGVLVVAVPGSARIAQLRLRQRRHRRTHQGRS